MSKQHNEAFLKLVEDAKKGIRECTVDDVLEKLGENEPFFFVDVREDDEWKAGRARGAKHLGRGVIERDIETEIPDRDAEIILYCGGGFRSALAAESLQKMGYKNVISMDGGIRAWRERGLPEERG
jgi:rhodanese-related sulfurtransferase